MFRKMRGESAAGMGMILALVACTAAACGDEATPDYGEDIVGMYRATYHTENPSGCAQEGVSILEEKGPKFFKLSVENFMGAEFVGYHACDSVAECEQATGVSWDGWLFSEQEGGDWVGEALLTSTSHTNHSTLKIHCTVSLTKYRATMHGTEIEMQRRTYHGAFDVSTEDDCNPDLAREKLAELSCAGFEVLRGTTQF